MWLPKLETVTYKRDTDGLLSYVGAEYAKTCVVVEPPPPLLLFLLLRWFARCCAARTALSGSFGREQDCALAVPQLRRVSRRWGERGTMKN